MKIKIKYEENKDFYIKRDNAKILINETSFDLKEAERLGYLILEKVREADHETHYGKFGAFQPLKKREKIYKVGCEYD